MNFSKILALLVVLSLASCNDDSAQKSAALKDREDNISARELEFAKKEAEYQSLVKMRDSLHAQQNILQQTPTIPANLLGKWKGKMVCTESDCADYVVGDTKVDEWQILNENGALVAKNVIKTGGLRIYNGVYDGKNLNFTHLDETGSQKKLDMKIDFTTVDSMRLAGTREVQVNGDCTAKFKIDLTRQ